MSSTPLSEELTAKETILLTEVFGHAWGEAYKATAGHGGL